mmetsp:Transcript_33449/g.88761  ORF Transcript_33449/g.88761 Transcript_33449/m.88761 type:complete len:113 (-) Transcript_33449:57-395(-)
MDWHGQKVGVASPCCPGFVQGRRANHGGQENTGFKSNAIIFPLVAWSPQGVQMYSRQAAASAGTGPSAACTATKGTRAPQPPTPSGGAAAASAGTGPSAACTARETEMEEVI